MNDIMISALLPLDTFNSQYDTANHYWACGGCMGNTTRNSSGQCTTIQAGLVQYTQVLRIEQGDTKNTRIIGLKTGTNPDGSYQIKLLGNNIRYSNLRKYKTYGLVAGITNTAPEYDSDTGNYSAQLLTTPTPTTNLITLRNNEVSYIVSDVTMIGQYPTSSDASLLARDGIDELPALDSYNRNTTRNIIEACGNFTASSVDAVTITTNVNNTPTFGLKNISNITLNRTYEKMVVSPWLIEGGKINPLKGYTGDNYQYISDSLAKIQPQANAQIKIEGASRRLYFEVPESVEYSASEYYLGLRYDNLHITSDYDKAIAYLNTGAIPDDDEYNEKSTSNPYPYSGEEPPEPPEPSEGQIENEDDSIDEGTDATYDENTDISLAGINWYWIQKDILQSFINWFWNDMTDWASVIINSITGLYGNMQNCVISIKKMHVAEKFLFDLHGGRDNTTDIKLGRYTCTLSNAANHLQKILSCPDKMVEVGSYNLPDTDNVYGFLDYSPYTAISIYLPYIGIVPIDTRYVRGRTITVFCSASYETGEILYCVKCGSYKVGYYSGKASIEVPFSLESGMQMATNAVNALGNIGASVAMGGALGATNLLGQDISAPTNINSSVTSALMRYGHTKCALIIQRPQHYKLYDTSQGKTVRNYAHAKGYKYNCVHTFKAGDGYVEFENPHIDNWKTAPTENEIQEIYSLMESGIVL